MHSISQSAFNSSSQSGSNSGSGFQPATGGGQAQQFTPSSYRYVPSSSTSGTSTPKKSYGGWIALAVVLVILFIVLKSCGQNSNDNLSWNTTYSNSDNSDIQGGDLTDNTAAEPEIAPIILLSDIEPLLCDNGDSFYTLDSILDATGETWNNIVHPGSTGTYETTGGTGSHEAKGFNRTYTNDQYSHFSGTIFLSREYALYTDHTLTLFFEVYGDDNLLYRAPYLETGLVVRQD